jgi:uncharacterized protein YjbI with pentapeptide repeats
MANPEHLKLIKSGVKCWNRWRKSHPEVRPDLSGEELSELKADVLILAEAIVNIAVPRRAPPTEGGLAGLELSRVNLRSANLRNTNLSRAILVVADLTEANLAGANLSGCILTNANLTRTVLTNANLHSATLRFAKLKRANLNSAILSYADLDGVDAANTSLRRANLGFANITGANFQGADFTEAYVYGLSAWNVRLEKAIQSNLRITRATEASIRVDDINTAQFIHTILENENLTRGLEALTTKIVLILGRFSPVRKVFLEHVKRYFLTHNYVPVLFDFDSPPSRDFTETVITLAHMARFIVADLTEPASIAKELEAIVPRLAIPVQPLLQTGAALYPMFHDYWKYDWVLPVSHYRDLADLLASFETNVVLPAEAKAKELLIRRASALGSVC